MPDDPLWDGGPVREPELSELERTLHALGAPPPAPDWSLVKPAAPRRSRQPWLLAAAAALVIAGGLAWWDARDTWTVNPLAGAPSIEGAWPWARGLGVGARLVTRAGERASISVDGIGVVEVAPGSRLRRLRGAKREERRLALEVGMVRAFIVAPPRRFVVEAPGAVATDLGCEYTLEVGPDGHGALRVLLGWVAFAHEGRESFVPAGACCETHGESGPGTPHYEDAPIPLVRALAVFDGPSSSSERRDRALDEVLASARPRDAFTLWHLLPRSSGDARARVADRLAILAPPPDTAPRARVLALDRDALDAWWDTLGMGDTSWWRTWEGGWPGSR